LTEAPAAPVETAPPPVADAEKAILLELRQRRQELEERDAALGRRLAHVCEDEIFHVAAERATAEQEPIDDAETCVPLDTDDANEPIVTEAIGRP